MNQLNLSRILLPALLIPLTVIVTINLLSGGGNQLGNVFLLMILFGAVLGLFAPRVGLLLFVVFQFYVDFLKRLLILGDTLSNLDVMISLGMGPVIVIAACVNSMLQCLTGRVPFYNKRDITFFFGCVAVSLLGFKLGTGAAASAGLAKTAQSVLGSSMLGMTAYATYVLVRDQADLHKVLKYTVLGAMPMALYTFFQHYHGISGWEEEYIRTGLSKVLYGFYLLDGINGMRPFSTLNTHTALGAVSAAIFLIAFLLMTRTKRLFGTPRSHRWFYICVSLLFLGSCYLSKNRTTYVLPFLGFFLVFLFNGGWRTLFFYLSAIVFFIWVVINSDWLNTSIMVWSSQIEGTGFGNAVGSLGTYQARLSGFMALADLNNWTPFGMDEGRVPLSHDQISETLLKMGYVSLFIMFLIGSVSAFWWHRKCLRVRNPEDRVFLVSLSAIIVSLSICGLAYGNMLFVSPVNSLLGVMIGLGMVTLRRDQAAKMLEVPAHVSFMARAIAGRGADLEIQSMNINHP